MKWEQVLTVCGGPLREDNEWMIRVSRGDFMSHSIGCTTALAVNEGTAYRSGNATNNWYARNGSLGNEASTISRVESKHVYPGHVRGNEDGCACMCGVITFRV